MAKCVLDKVIFDLFSAKRYWRRCEKTLEIMTYQNVYLSGDLRYNDKFRDAQPWGSKIVDWPSAYDKIVPEVQTTIKLLPFDQN